MKKLLASLIAIGWLAVIVLYADSGTPSTLRILTDASGNLVTAGAVLTGSSTSSTFKNTRLNTDSSGNLLVAINGGTITPTTILVGNGTAAAPSIAFASDTGIGLFRVSGTTSLGLSSAGVETLRLSSGATINVGANSLVFGATFNTPDTFLVRDAANTLALKNGTNAQTFRVYSGTSTYSSMGIGGFVSSGVTTAVSNTTANSCGTTAAVISTGSNSNSGSFTVGATAGTNCTLTFPTAALTRRECTASNETTANLTRTTYIDTTHSTIEGTFVAGDTVSYVCFAR